MLEVGATSKFRNLAHDAIEARIRVLNGFWRTSNEYPATWTPPMVEKFFSDLLEGFHHRAGAWAQRSSGDLVAGMVRPSAVSAF
jgi:hypothetical protein